MVSASADGSERTVELSFHEHAPMILAGILPLAKKGSLEQAIANIADVEPQATNPQTKKIIMVDLQYPYGKQKIYLNGSLIAVCAQLMAMCHKVEIVDLNIDSLDDESVRNKFHNADVIGVSLIGSPYIPSAITFAQKMTNLTNADIVMGGQVIEAMERSQFDRLFSGTNAKRAENLAEVLGCDAIPNAYSVPFAPVYRAMGDDRLKLYMEREMTMVLAQGCALRCKFCAARKITTEFFRDIDVFSNDLEYMVAKAKVFGIDQLEFYTSSLDFFQSSQVLHQYLEAIAQIQEESGVVIKIRCLATMTFFLKAHKEIEGLDELLDRAGVWCIGFGVDGADEEVWEAQKKRQNKLNEVVECLDLCKDMGVRAEILMVTGFPEDTPTTLFKNVRNSWRYAARWPNTYLRPYLAKQAVPGNDEWKIGNGITKACLENPDLFYNLDFCAMGSRLTHPRTWHRWTSNAAYLAIILPLAPFGRSCTSPLFPQGIGGILGKLAKLINRIMPFDR